MSFSSRTSVNLLLHTLYMLMYYLIIITTCRLNLIKHGKVSSSYTSSYIYPVINECKTTRSKIKIQLLLDITALSQSFSVENNQIIKGN